MRSAVPTSGSGEESRVLAALAMCSPARNCSCVRRLCSCLPIPQPGGSRTRGPRSAPSAKRSLCQLPGPSAALADRGSQPVHGRDAHAGRRRDRSDSPKALTRLKAGPSRRNRTVSLTYADLYRSPRRRENRENWGFALNKRHREFESTPLHHSVHRFLHLLENRPKSARVRAIFDCARTFTSSGQRSANGSSSATMRRVVRAPSHEPPDQAQ
jgi:hypothetical protein